VKVTVCQLDPRSHRLSEQLAELGTHLRSHNSDLLLLPEMAFSEWLAADPEPSAERWQSAVEDHERRIGQITDLRIDSIVGTRPTVNAEGSRRNEAFVWSAAAGGAIAVHEKYYLPNEEGFWESSWYDRGSGTFDTAQAGDALIGIQICTEMWFFEWARRYAASGIDLLCIPRATPHATTDKWLAGGRAAAVSSGAFSISSNLWYPVGAEADCGGTGWVIDPDGEILAVTSESEPFVTADVDLDIAARSKSTYPRYVPE